MKWTALALAALVFSPSASADEAIFRAGGLFMAPAGNIGLPIQIWNPKSDPAFPSSLPYRVPTGKTLLLTDLYMETDPQPGAAFLLAVYVETGDDLSLLQTIQLREPVDRHVALTTPIPIRAGDVLNVQFSSLTPSRQAVAWNVGARLVDEINTVQNAAEGGVAPKAAQPYPIPNLYDFPQATPTYDEIEIALSLDNASLVSPIEVDAFASPETHAMALVVEWDGNTARLDRSIDLGSTAIPILIATAGTSGPTIVNPRLPDCETFNAVVLGGPWVGQFPVTDCVKGQIKIEAAFDLQPGQRLQPQMIEVKSPTSP